MITGIFDTVSITDEGYLVACYINNTVVFKTNSSNTNFWFYNTEGTQTWSATNNETSSYSYIAVTDNAVFFSTNNGNGNREYIFGKESDGKGWWHFVYSKDPGGTNNNPRTTFFDTTSTPFTYSHTTSTNNNFSRLTQCVSISDTGYRSIGIYQMYLRQSNLPTSIGETQEVCYKVDIGGGKFVTSGQWLLPYSDS